MKVRALVAKLLTCNQDADIVISGPDSGGYDVTFCLSVTVTPCAGVDLVVRSDKFRNRARRLFPEVVLIEGDCEPNDFWDVIHHNEPKP